jgi:uncharacterized protein with PhoU and TrkA domain
MMEEIVELIEQISSGSKPLAMIIRRQYNPEQTTFLTPLDYEQQVGFVVHQAGDEIVRHSHRPAPREIISTPEVLFVKQGRCVIDIYDDEQTLVKTSELLEGDIMLMIGGGHGFRMLEDTVFVEVKQGPYRGVDEKIQF